MRLLFGLTKILLLVFIISCLIKLTSAYLFVPDSLNKDNDWLSDTHVKKEQQNDTKKEVDSNRKDSLPQAEVKPKTNGLETDNGASSQDKVEYPEQNENIDDRNSESNQYFLTLSEINSIDSISIMDKIKGFSILSKLKKQDFNEVFHIAKGGITLSEMKDFMQILENNLNPKDIATLNDILLKNKKQYSEDK